jgi:hypothetical protein
MGWVTLLALLTVDALLGDLEDLAVVLVELLVLQVALGGLLELAVHLLPLECAVHHLLDILHTLLVLALLKDRLYLLWLEVVV